MSQQKQEFNDAVIQTKGDPNDMHESQQNKFLIEIGQEFENKNVLTEQFFKLFEQLYNDFTAEEEIQKKTVISSLLELVDDQNILGSIYIYSFVIKLLPDSNYLVQFQNYLFRHISCFRADTLNFLFQQLKCMMFINKELESIETKSNMMRLLQHICREFEEMITADLEYIPVNRRNDKLIVVIAEQILSEMHGPTKTAYDRCYTIIKHMNCNVLLINSAECLASAGRIPYFMTSFGNYRDDYVEKSELEWKDCKIPYVQCDITMPDIDSLNMLLKYIRDLKPIRIVSIGGSGILANLASKMISAVTIGLGPSDISFTCTRYQALGKVSDASDMEILSQIGLDADHVIESVFTSDFRQQTEFYQRKDLGFPEDKMILFTTGTRFDMEIDDAFISMLEHVFEKSDVLYFVFIGKFDKYQYYADKYPLFGRNSKCLGFCTDVIAISEVCDLYVNPTRKGGGTSVQEAMIKGKPAVSVLYGDVATNIGEEFCVNAYEEMEQVILRYASDPDYYHEMSEKGLLRMEKLTDTKGEFIKIIVESLKREINSES